MALSIADFKTVVNSAPLVSVDLILRDAQDRVALGLRTNEPAKGFFFAPGGRVRKLETIESALARISKAETGRTLKMEDGRFVGLFQHMYPDSTFMDGSPIAVHYIVMALEYRFAEGFEMHLDDQHEDVVWMTVPEILSSDRVHPICKAYFDPNACPGVCIFMNPRSTDVSPIA